MALSKEDMATLKKDLMAVRGKKLGFFLYCAGGADGDPVLMVSKKKIPRKELSNLKMTARKKKFVQGDLLYQPKPEGGEPVFYFLADKSSALFQKHIKTFFSKAFSKLKKSQFELSEEGKQAEEAKRSRGSEGAAQKEPLEQDDLQATKARESGIEETSIDAISLTDFQKLSDPAKLVDELSKLKLGDINFERLDISDKPKEKQKELYAQQEKELDQRTSDLEALLQLAYSARVKAEKEEQEALAEYGRMKREKADKTARGKYKSVVVERRKNASDLLDQENEIRALLQVAHAQRQNCILDREEVCDAMTEASAAQFMSKENLEQVQKAAEEQEIRCNECSAHVNELKSTLELLEKEERTALISLENKEKTAKKKGEKPKYKEKAQKRLEDLRSRKEKILHDLSIREKELDTEKALMLLRQAKSNEYLDQWTEGIKEHWEQRGGATSEQVQSLAEKDQQLKQKQEMLRDSKGKERTLSNQKEEKERELKELEHLEKDVEAKIKVQKDKLALIEKAIKGSGFFTDTKGLKKEKADLEAKIAELGLELRNATDDAKKERIKTLQTEVATITADLTQEQNHGLSLQEEVHTIENEVNSMLLSDKEQEMANVLQVKTAAATALVQKMEKELETAKKHVEDSQAKLTSYTDAEKKREQAIRDVFAAEAMFRSIKAEAGKSRMGGKSRKAKIDAARAELPIVQERLRLAQEALKQANEELTTAQSSVGADLHGELEKLEEARKLVFEKEIQLSESKAHQLELEKQEHEQSAQIAAITEDVFREQREKNYAQFLDALTGEEGEGIKAQLKEAKEEKSAASKALEQEVNALVDTKLQLAEIHEKLKGAKKMDEIMTLSETQQTLIETLQAQTSSVEEKEQVLENAKRKNQEAKAMVLAHAKKLEQEQGENADLAYDLLVSEDAFRHAKEEQDKQQKAVLDAQKQVEEASKAKQDARRREALLPLQTEMKELLMQESTKELVKNFHFVSDDLQKMECLDLLSAADQKKIRKDKKKSKAYDELLELQNTLNEKALEMISKGATRDELEQAFSDIPNTLRPAAYRAEIARFDEIQEMLTNAQLQDQLTKEADKLAAKKEDPQTLLKKIKDGLKSIPGEEAADFMADQMNLFNDLSSQGLFTDADGNLALDYTASQSADSSSTAGMKSFAGASSSGATQLDEIRAMNSQITSGYQFLKSGAALIEYAKVDPNVLDPVERIEHEEKIFDLMSDATSASLQATSNFASHSAELMKQLPIINLFSIIDDGKGMLENMVKTGARRLNAAYDKYLGMAAKATGSAIAGALEESQKQENALKVKYGIKSFHSVAGITADILSAFPGTAAIGAVMGAVNMVSGWISGAVVDKNMRNQILKAKNLLDRANQGDEEAKVELFKNHALYAKGLIAHMAEQNDSFALAYVQKRGLSQEAVEGSSKEIVMRYLLKQAEQNEEDYDDDKLGSLSMFGKVLAGGKRAISAIGSLFGSTLWNLQYDQLIQQTEKFESSITQLKPLYKQTDIAIQDLERKKKDAHEKRVEHLDKQIKKIEQYKDNFISFQAEGIKDIKEHLKNVAKAEKQMDELEKKKKSDTLSITEKSMLDGYTTIVPVCSSSLKNSLLALSSFV